MRSRITVALLAAVAALSTLTACNDSTSRASGDRVFTIVDRPRGQAYVLCSRKNGPSFRVPVSDAAVARAKVGDTCPKASRS